MLVADDFLLECGGPAYRRGSLTFFVLCAVIGAPLSWHKTSGGDVLVWVGFELLLRSQLSRHLGEARRMVHSVGGYILGGGYSTHGGF